MATIYQLTNEAQTLVDHLLFEEDDEMALKMLDTIYGDIVNKLKFVSTLYAESLALDAGYDAALKQLQERKKSSDRRIKRLKDYLLFGMQENSISRVDGDYISLRLQKNPPSVKYSEFFDIEKLPDDLVTVIPETKKPLAKAIKDAITCGNEVPGCWLEQGVSLRVA